MMAKKDDDTPHDPETGEVLEPDESEGRNTRMSPSRYPHDAEPVPTLDSFDRLIQALEGGALNDELSRELRDLGARMVQMAANYGGKVKGKMVLTLDFALNKGEIAIDSKVKVERPMPPRGSTHFWPTGDGRISQVNPKQMDMFRAGKPRAV